jgi:hypothetical protein
VPRLDVLVSGTVQSLPGPEIQANYALPTAVAARTLGRPLSGGAANVTVGLVRPGTVFGDRVNQVDLRIGKLLHLARMRETVSLDFYNALNVSSTLAQNNTFGTSWLRPTQIMPPRFAKVSLQLVGADLQVGPSPAVETFVFFVSAAAGRLRGFPSGVAVPVRNRTARRASRNARG